MTPFLPPSSPSEAIRLEPRIPLYVAAAAPKAAEIAGEYGDGLITATIPEPQLVGAILQQARDAARQAGREVGQFPYLVEGPIGVLHTGETLASPRLIDIAQPTAMVFFKWLAALQMPVEMVPEPARASFQAYLGHIERQKVPAAERHLAIWEGAFTVRPEERRFVTPDVIRAFTLVGERDEVIERIHGLARAGLTQFVVWPHPAVLRWEISEYLDDVQRSLTS